MNHITVLKAMKRAKMLNWIPKNEEEYYEETVEFKRHTTNMDFDPEHMLKMITWNVSSLRSLASEKPWTLSYLAKKSPDLICLQETKLSTLENSEHIAPLPGYISFDSISWIQKGYSGTRTYVQKNLKVSHSEGFIGVSDPHEQCPQGRIITTELTLPQNKTIKKLKIVNTYVPISGCDSATQDSPSLHTRLRWDLNLRRHLLYLRQQNLIQKKETSDLFVSSGCDGRRISQNADSRRQKANIIWVGDFNVMENWDHYWKQDYSMMLKTPGFSIEERKSFRDTLKSCDMIDGFRSLYPIAAQAYTFWDSCKKRICGNRGLRLDGFIFSRSLLPQIVDIFPLTCVSGSNHCPVELWLRI